MSLFYKKLFWSSWLWSTSMTVPLHNTASEKLFEEHLVGLGLIYLRCFQLQSALATASYPVFCSPWWYSKYRHTAICFFFASDSSILRSDFVWGFSLREVPPELYQVFKHIQRDTERAIRLVIKWTAKRLDLGIRKEKTYPNKKFFNVIHNRGVTILRPSRAAAHRNYVLQTYPFTPRGSCLLVYMVAMVNIYYWLMQKSLPALIKTAVQKWWHCIAPLLF